MSAKNTRILLIEDNPNDMELILRVLKKNGLTEDIHTSMDGAEALEFLFGADGRPRRGTIPRVIFLDIKLPKIDGFEVLKRVKSEETTRLIPVVILTSSQEEKDILECYNLGANSYIIKSVNFEKFAQSIAELGLYWLNLNQTAQ